MRLIIAGGRNYIFKPIDYSWLDMLRAQVFIEEVVCGEARGADTCGKNWALSRGIPVASFPADWDKHGRAAGPIRNQEMAEYAIAEGNGGLVAFPGQGGTNDMVKRARRIGLKVWDWRVFNDRRI